MKEKSDEEFQMNPIEKYIKLSKFPWKLIVHVLLCIVTSFQSMIVSESSLGHSRAEHRYFYYWFIETDPLAYNHNDFARYIDVFEIDQLNETLRKHIDNYYNIGDDSIEEFEYVLNESNKKSKDIEVVYMYLNEMWDPKLPKRDVITNNYTAFLELPPEKLRKFLTKLKQITMKYRLVSRLPPSGYYASSCCYYWKIDQKINFDHMSHAVISLDISQESCKGSPNFYWNHHYWIHYIVLFFALFSIYLSLKHFYFAYYSYTKFIIKKETDEPEVGEIEERMELVDKKNAEYFGEVQRRNVNYSSLELNASFQQSSEVDKKPKKKQKETQKFVNSWNVVALGGGLCQIAGCFTFIFDVHQRLGNTVIFIGFGCFFAWVNILRYLAFNASYFFMFSALMRSMPTVVRYMIGMIPIFVGFAFFGTTIFWQSQRFESTARTLYIQVALLYGDIIYDVFDDLTKIDFTWSQIYLYSFIILCICVIQNLFISIIQRVYSEDRKVEIRAILQKEKEEKMEEEALQQRQKDIERRIKTVSGSKTTEEFRNTYSASIEEISAQLETLKLQIELERRNLSEEENQELNAVYTQMLDSLNTKLAEMRNEIHSSEEEKIFY